MAVRAHLATAIAAALTTLLVPAVAAATTAQRTHGPDPAALATAPTASAASSPGDWCGNTDPAANQVDNGDYRYHAIYVHPADRASRLSALGAELQDDAFGASAMLETQYGRAIRFDVGTPCGRNDLDISELRLPFTYDQLGAFAQSGGTATFEAIAQALREAGMGVADDNETIDELSARRENYLVWLDAPAPAQTCGQGTALLDTTRSDTNLNNFGGKLALVFRSGSGFCGADVVRHEIGHNLGALQPDAPHTTDGVHCNDAYEDTMCQLDSPKVADGTFAGRFFDYGNDDYWDPPQGPALGWWTVNLSRFLCPDPDCNRPDPPAPVANQVPSASDAARSTTTRKARTLPRPQLHRRVVHRGRRYVSVRIRARGRGSVRLVVKCPHRRVHPHGTHPRRILSRRVALPSSVRVRTVCRAPRAHFVRWHRPRSTHA